MTPKEKAEELFRKFYMILFDADSDISAEIMISILSIQSAGLAIDELINANPHSNPLNSSPVSTMDYWAEVKSELLKL